MEAINSINNKGNYTKTEKCYQAWERQIKHLDTEVEYNKIYWEEFSNNKFTSEKQKKGSMAQYKSSIFNFMEFIDKDICLVTRDDLNAFVSSFENQNTVENKIAHIKSILTYIVQNNTVNCLDRISKETLILVIQI
jgi:hypothetical protein